MKSDTLDMPGDQERLCSNVQELLNSKHFIQFLEIYNKHTAENRMSREPATVEDVLRDRNLRNRMRSFFREQINIRITGSNGVTMVKIVSDIIDRVVVLLDERNKKISSGEITEGEFESQEYLVRHL